MRLSLVDNFENTTHDTHANKTKRRTMMDFITTNLSIWWFKPMNLSHVLIIMSAFMLLLCLVELVIKAWLAFEERKQRCRRYDDEGNPVWVPTFNSDLED
jgi:hypothetical protein